MLVFAQSDAGVMIVTICLGVLLLPVVLVVAVIVLGARGTSRPRSDKESVSCPDCGQAISPLDETCPGCGRPLWI